MKSIVIIHFQPLERYPPIMNLANVLKAGGLPTTRIIIFTTYPLKKKALYKANCSNIIIKRIGRIDPMSNAIIRLWGYLNFHFITLILTLHYWPRTIAYFETISSFPALCYNTIFNSKSRIIAHYHEYVSNPEYATQMQIVKLFHTLEKKHYNKYSWISQTTTERLQLFLKDNPEISNKNVFILPNYPPSNWITRSKRKITEKQINIIYVGALSLQTMFIEELCNWILKKNGIVKLDIYSDNFTQDSKEYICNLNSSIIKFAGPIEYYEMPNLLKSYDVGVILYKGLIPNYTYTAPNKLFEYLSCGLDVWFADKIKGIYPYVTENTYPKVLPVDFKNLENFDLELSLDRSQHKFNLPTFTCETAVNQLQKHLLN